jgi:hypothetical protein
MYLYFAGRLVAVRLAMQQRGIRIGGPETVKLFNIFGMLWDLIGVLTIITAVAALPLQYNELEIVIQKTRRTLQIVPV